MSSSRVRLAALLLALPLTCSALAGTAGEKLEIVTAAKTHSFRVELALTPKEQERGLMFRTELPESSGMLFVFPEERVAHFWMVNTLIPLDALFLDRSGRVLKIAEMMEPRSPKLVSSEVPVKAVLELGGGVTRRRAIRPGDRVLHPLLGSREGR
jgi:uncharacterized protein